MRANKSPKKSPSLISPTGVIKLVTHAMMGAALGLAFALALTLSNPAVANLLNHGGSQAVLVFALTLVTTFAIGATLTGIVFILVEDKES
jgi:Na+/proline symporter